MLDTREHKKALLLWMKALPLQRGLTQHSCWTCLWRGEHQVRLPLWLGISTHVTTQFASKMVFCPACQAATGWLPS